MIEMKIFGQNAPQLWKKRGGKFKAKELSIFCQELSSLLVAGVNLVCALTILKQEKLPRKRIKVYDNILNEVSAGNSLSTAMERQGVFPDLMLGMIRSAEGNGNLDGVTARLARDYAREHKLNEQIRSAMIYPCILVVMALIAMVVIFTVILPKFEKLFNEMEALPNVTIILMAISNFLVKRWYAALGGAVLAAVLVCILQRVPAIRLWLDKLKLKTSFFGIGKLNAAICTARFARTICSLYSCGMPLVSALQTARETVGNRYLASQFDVVAARVCAGETLSGSLRKVDGLQKKLCGVIQVGEETGQLDNMLDFIADAMEYDGSMASKRLVTLMEPAMIVFIALFIAVIMLGVMNPIIGSYGVIAPLG